MSKPNAKILVIIVTWNKKEYVVNLLHSLAQISYPSELMDILVVDNASNDGTVAALKHEFPHIKIIANTENLGGTGGFNTGLAWAFEQPEQTYDFLWLLDNDVMVHKDALTNLVHTLEANPDAAVAGSTMLQLDYPWQINEMGAYIDKIRGSLILNRHFEQIPNWRAKSIHDLLQADADLTKHLIHCQPYMDVDYVAAASLLIRTVVAKKAGLWMDFFIHFDDVEWCLRISKMGHRILVSARSLIWHLSAAAKIPTWILYYDNRNILYLLDKHSQNPSISIKESKRYIAKKALYYALLGKQDLAQLHLDAIADFDTNVTGKKDITLKNPAKPVTEISSVFLDPNIKRILISCCVNLQATKMQAALVSATKTRNDLEVFYLTPPKQLAQYPTIQFPGSIPLHISSSILWRYWQYFRIRNQFDLVIQSDYHAILPLSWLGKETIFINDESFCRLPKTKWQNIISILPKILSLLFQQK